MHIDCHVICHNSCIEGFPNNCGLPAELVSHTLLPSTPITTKSSVHDKPVLQNELDDFDTSPFVTDDQILMSTPMTMSPFRGTGMVVKSERLVYLK